jgi:dihydropyrimidine dehydrogenase (NAD+) subunit PreT
MKKLTLDLAKQEASKCLLCYDAPCVQACPANLNVADIIRSLRFDNLRGAKKELIADHFLETTCADLCEQKKYCKNACLRAKLDDAVQIEELHKFVLNLSFQGEKVLDNGK